MRDAIGYAFGSEAAGSMPRRPQSARRTYGMTLEFMGLFNWSNMLNTDSVGHVDLTLFIKPVNCFNRGGQLSSYGESSPLGKLPVSVNTINRRYFLLRDNLALVRLLGWL